MPPPPQTTAGGSTFDKSKLQTVEAVVQKRASADIPVKMGAMMGTGVGLTIGFIFGGFSVLSGGPGPRGAMATMSQYMLSSAATFGFFMSIGSVIRTDSPYPLPADRMRRLQSNSPIAGAWRRQMEVEVKPGRI